MRPKTFSETKMANYSQEVYSRFREMVPALLMTLEEVKREYDGSGGSEGSEKAHKADSLMAKVYHAIFLMTLSVLIDIYIVYSAISANFQVVNRFAFTRMDNFNKSLVKFQEMLSSVDVADCSCSSYYNYEDSVYKSDKDGEAWNETKMKKEMKMKQEICQWETFHGDVRKMKSKSEYRGVVIGCLAEDGSKTRAGASQTMRVRLLDVDKVVETVTERARSVTTFLHTGLSNSVYTGGDVIMINNVRRLLDLKTLIAEINLHGAASTSSVKWRAWSDSAKFIENDLFARISADELRLQFRDFVRRLGDLQKEEVEELDNTGLFGLFLDPQKELYLNIESVISVMARAGLVMGLESVVESWVSKMEHHNNPKRALSQERLENESMVAINGPAVPHCDGIVEEALELYWAKAKRVGEKGGHWIRKSDNIIPYIVSAAVDTIVKKKPEVNFML